MTTGEYKMHTIDLTRNLESIAVALHDEAPTEAAREYIEILLDNIMDRGSNWIDAHADMLHINSSAEELESTFPVEDNRLWFIEQWQMALNERAL